jgi:hypothetical protein
MNNLIKLCQCGECVDLNNFYVCDICKRSAPYCYGADDDMFTSCDSCWVAAHPEYDLDGELKVIFGNNK